MAALKTRRKYYEEYEADDLLSKLTELETYCTYTGQVDLTKRPFFHWEINCPVRGWQGIVEKGGFILISGKEKSKKSTLAGMFTSAFLSTNYIDTTYGFREFQRIRCNSPWNHAALYFDTEQPKADFETAQAMIIKNSGIVDGKKPQNYYPYQLSRFGDPVLRYQMIIAKIIEIGNKMPIGLVVLDVVTDLVENDNDSQQAKDFYSLLFELREKYGFDLIGVIHQNRGNDMTNGSIGVVSNKKCNYLIKLTVEEEMAAVPGEYKNTPTKAVTEMKRKGEFFKEFTFGFVDSIDGSLPVPAFLDLNVSTQFPGAVNNSWGTIPPAWNK